MQLFVVRRSFGAGFANEERTAGRSTLGLDFMPGFRVAKGSTCERLMSGPHKNLLARLKPGELG